MKFHSLVDYFVRPSQSIAGHQLFYARNTTYAALLSIFTSIFFILLYLYLDYFAGLSAVLLEVLAMCGVLAFLRITSSVLIARELICTILFSLFFWLSTHQGGLLAPSMIWLVILPAIATFMGGFRPCLTWSLLITLTLVICFFLQLSGIIFPTDTALVQHHLLLEAASTLGLLFVLMALVLFFELTKQHGFNELQTALLKIETLVTHDSLTGAYNRHHVLLMLDNEKKRAQRSRRPLSICMIDIDLFKKVNDQYGHAAGDQVLKKFSTLVQSTIRAGDHWGRYGGEEFLLVLPETSVEYAEHIARRVCQQLSQLAFPEFNEHFHFTISVGITMLHHGEDIAQLIDRADTALYQAKNSGRNSIKSIA